MILDKKIAENYNNRTTVHAGDRRNIGGSWLKNGHKHCTILDRKTTYRILGKRKTVAWQNIVKDYDRILDKRKAEYTEDRFRSE
jgi:hypothetical protein